MAAQHDPDVIVLGGGAAGSSAALVLGRARVRTLLVDAGRPSNEPSTGIGGLLGHDGTTPADFYRRAAEELAAYPAIERRSATVTAIRPDDAARWRVELDDGDAVRSDRLVLAMGMRYAVPELDGLEGRWGASVFHCPFCHGWEHRDQPLAVLGGPGMTVERSLLLRRWTDDLVVITGDAVLTDEERHRLAGAGVGIIDGRIARLHGPGRQLAAVTLDDGRTVAVTGLLVPAPQVPRQPSLLEGLDLATTPSGHLAIDDLGATSAPGIWAAGDLTTPIANVARAIAGGSTCAVAVTHDLVAGYGA